MKTFTSVAAALAACLAVNQADAWQPIGIGSSPEGTLPYQIGAAYGQAVTDELGRQTRVQPQSGTGVPGRDPALRGEGHRRDQAAQPSARTRARSAT